MPGDPKGEKSQLLTEPGSGVWIGAQHWPCTCKIDQSLRTPIGVRTPRRITVFMLDAAVVAAWRVWSGGMADPIWHGKSDSPHRWQWRPGDADAARRWQRRASIFLVTSASDLAISASPSDVLPLRKGFSKTPFSKRSGDACRPHTDSGCCRPRSGARHRQKQPPPGSVPTGACRWMVWG